MKIVLAQRAGFCFGVKRAATMAFEAADEHRHICSLGPIIHSPQLVKRLEEKGVQVVRRVADIHSDAVIIRSHGVTAGEMREVLDRGLTVVDTTCPFVKKAQDHAAQLGREGYGVVIVGEEDHPEVQGIVSFAGAGEVFVVSDSAQAEKLPRRNKLGVVAQTTQAFDNLRQVTTICLEKSKELRIFNTICDATLVRQNEAMAIAREVDLMLVIGGQNSANTSRLASICAEIQPRTYHVETAGQIQAHWFAGVASVGVTAGASTPRWLIEEVVERVTEINQ
jgi:4-hydroxy-3-methylbut-2-en-1-yl diphosphate reductase